MPTTGWQDKEKEKFAVSIDNSSIYKKRFNHLFKKCDNYRTLKNL
jgi:hypothetical protein